MLEPKHGDLPSPSLKQVASFDALDPCAWIVIMKYYRDP
jgi:hypothetical protein